METGFGKVGRSNPQKLNSGTALLPFYVPNGKHTALLVISREQLHGTRQRR